MFYNVLLVVLGGVVLSAAECSNCTCFDVNITSVNLYELLNFNPLYSQAASNSSLSSNFDSVCLSFSATHTPDNILAEIKFSYLDGSSDQTASIQSTYAPGHFSIVGPTNYEDFILGIPCPGTYVIYRCLQIDSCTTDPLAVDVIVTSSRRKDIQYCIDRGIEIAQTNFPGLEFYSLPGEALNPCSKY